MENKHAYSRKKMILFPLAFFISLGSLLICRYLPTSDFANSIERSGMDGVYAFISSPVLALFCVGVLIFAMAMNRGAFVPVLGKKVYAVLEVLFTALFTFGFASSLAYLIYQWKLGFLAPFDGTMYQTLHDIMLVGLMLTVTFFLVITVIIKKKK